MKIDLTKYAAMVANAASQVKISSTIFKAFIADVKSVIDGNDDVVAAHAAESASETVKAHVELATAAETTTGTDDTRAVHPAGLKVELNKKLSLAGGTMTGGLIFEHTKGITFKDSVGASQTFAYMDASNVINIGDTDNRIKFIANNGNYEFNGLKLFVGAGSPEGVFTAPIGSLFLRVDGGASTTLYVKQSGTGNTGWTAK